MVQYEIEENGIRFFAPSIITQETLQQQEEFLNLLRNTFERSDLALPIEIDATRFPDYKVKKGKPKKSAKEIFVEMAHENPLLIELQKQLDLNQ